MILAFSREKTKIKIKRYCFRLITAVLAFFILLGPNVTQARNFDPHNIISDNELLDKDSLTKTAIQKFLERENSVLARYSQNIDGRTLKASEIVWEIAQRHGINPKFLLTTLEKEQGLIQKSQATEKAFDWATGYGCYGGSCKEKYRGFYNQIDATAETQKIYIEKAGQFSFRVNVPTKTYDDFVVIPENQATANLYLYTPYVGYSPELGVTGTSAGGNKLFWRIWHKYFSSQKLLDGQIATDGSSFWLIKDGKKNQFTSNDVFLADYKVSDAIKLSAEDLAAYPNGPKIYLSQNTLAKSQDNGQIYLIEDNSKRPITDSAALTLLSDFKIAVAESEIPAVPETQLQSFEAGQSIDSTSIYPQGKLFKDEYGQIWFLKDGMKSLVDPLIWTIVYGSKELTVVNSLELDKYPIGSPVKFPDGTFLLSDGKYYLISDGERMRVDDQSIFDRIFGLDKKQNAIAVSAALLEVHDAGEIIDYIDDTVKDAIVSGNSATVGTYAASFESVSPEALIMFNGQSQTVNVVFKNTGSAVWQPGNVWLKVTEKDKETNTFEAGSAIGFAESSVGSGELATFNFDLTAPTSQSGVLNQEFSLYANQNNTPTKIASAAKLVIVKSAVSAQIVEQNLPVAVKTKWKPVPVTIKIKNTSADTIWLSKKTALEIYNGDGKASPFYDPKDWVRKEVAAVPVKKSTIKPGEVGEFNFTLDPARIKPGDYTIKLKLKLLDKNKEVYLNGKIGLDFSIRVDK